jgi:hypothetical protein
MKREAGIWIDHRKAVIVTITGDELETKQIQSNMEKHVRFSGRSSEDGSPEDIRDRQFTDHLSSFYDDVIVAIREWNRSRSSALASKVRDHLQRAKMIMGEVLLEVVSAGRYLLAGSRGCMVVQKYRIWMGFEMNNQYGQTQGRK